jgi:hypothetical protein
MQFLLKRTGFVTAVHVSWSQFVPSLQSGKLGAPLEQTHICIPSSGSQAHFPLLPQSKEQSHCGYFVSVTVSFSSWHIHLDVLSFTSTHRPPMQEEKLQIPQLGWLSDPSLHKHLGFPFISTHFPCLQFGHFKGGQGGLTHAHSWVPWGVITQTSPSSQILVHSFISQLGGVPPNKHTHLNSGPILTHCANSPQS